MVRLWNCYIAKLLGVIIFIFILAIFGYLDKILKFCYNIFRFTRLWRDAVKNGKDF